MTKTNSSKSRRKLAAVAALFGLIAGAAGGGYAISLLTGHGSAGNLSIQSGGDAVSINPYDTGSVTVYAGDAAPLKFQVSLVGGVYSDKIVKTVNLFGASSTNAACQDALSGDANLTDDVVISAPTDVSATNGWSAGDPLVGSMLKSGYDGSSAQAGPVYLAETTVAVDTSGALSACVRQTVTPALSIVVANAA